jgi:uncharacterized protein (TIGR03643 family)
MLSEEDIDRIIEMAWEDRTPFEAIEAQFQLREADVIMLMRKHLKASSWRRWRKRVILLGLNVHDKSTSLLIK